jgi:hypothetical protein
MTDESSPIITDGHADNDGVDAFLESFKSEDERKRPSTQEHDEAAGTDSAETPDGEGDTSEQQETEEQTSDGEGEQQEIDPDDVEHEIKVGDKVEKAKLKDLKRLFGQEAALTQKSQKLAESQRAAETQFTAAQTALNKMFSKAQERWAEYQKLDMLVLAQRMDTENFEQLRQDAAAAEAEFKFYGDELKGLMQTKAEEDAKAYRTAANACIQALNDPNHAAHIPGISKESYEDMAAWTDKFGVKGFRQVTDPAAIKIVHMAMQWQKSEDARKAAAAKVKSAPNKPTKVMRPGASQANGNGKAAQAMKTLRQRGDVESAEAAFLASFKS